MDIQGMIFKNNKIWFPWIIDSNFITICKWYTDFWLALSEQELKTKVFWLIRIQMQFSFKFYQALRFGFLHGKHKQKTKRRTSHNRRMYAIIMFSHLFCFPKIKINKYKSMQLLWAPKICVASAKNTLWPEIRNFFRMLLSYWMCLHCRELLVLIFHLVSCQTLLIFINTEEKHYPLSFTIIFPNIPL